MGSLIQSGMIKQEGKQTKVSKIRMYVYIYRYIMLIHMYIHMHTLEALKWECAVFKVEKRNVSKCFPDYYWGSSKISFYYFSCFFFSFKMIQYMPPRWLDEKKYFPRKPNDLGLILETMWKGKAKWCTSVTPTFLQQEGRWRGDNHQGVIGPASTEHTVWQKQKRLCLNDKVEGEKWTPKDVFWLSHSWRGAYDPITHTWTIHNSNINEK